MATQAIVDKPNGPVAAALIAGGIGSAVMGILASLTDMSTGINSALNWYSPVGSLTGKAILEVVFFLGSWIILGTMWRGKEVNFKNAALVAFILLAIGVIFTFPPVFDVLPRF